MKKKLTTYIVLPVLGLVLVGSGVASAHWGFGGLGPVDPEKAAAKHTAMFENHAQLLGISVEEIKNAWAEGKSLKQLAEEKGITQEQLHEKMKAAKLENLKAQLNALVSKGVITQAQADKRLSVMSEHINSAEHVKVNGGKMMGKMHKEMML